MQFSMQAVTFLIGLGLIVVGIFGGGIEVKEIKIPTLPTLSRVLCSGVGLVLIVVCLAFPQLLLSSPPAPPPPIPAVSAVGDKQKFLGASIENHIVTVGEVKLILRHLGKYNGPLNDEASDAYFRAVGDFQSSQKISVDGLVGPETYGKLRDACPECFAQK